VIISIMYSILVEVLQTHVLWGMRTAEEATASWGNGRVLDRGAIAGGTKNEGSGAREGDVGVTTRGVGSNGGGSV
jgi:hypothetical protein